MPVELIVCGAAGRMGRSIIRLLRDEPRARLAAAIEAEDHVAVSRDAGELAGGALLGVPVSANPEACIRAGQVVVDFTVPAASLRHFRAAVAAGAAAVIGTTGFSPAERAEMDALAARGRSVVAANMSAGVNVLMKLVETAARTLGDQFDPEIVEIHHRFKVDAPSGTALALGRTVAGALGRDFDQEARLAREGMVGARRPREIGIVALRGGDVVGDHTVVFAGDGERLELTHRTQSRDSLARGAIRAALWVADRPPGRYSMFDVLGL